MSNKFSTLSAVGVMAVAALAASSVQAQAPATALAQGPAIPGMCIVSVDQVAETSTVGQYVINRLGQLGTQVKSELSPEETSFATDAKAFDAARPTLDKATLESRGAALQTRYTDLQRKANLLQAELEATQKKAFNRISQEIKPIVEQVYQQHHCSLLINKEAVIIPNPSVDLTADTVTALNAKITQFPFELEHLDSTPAK